MKLENKYLSQNNKKWEFEEYKWFVPDEGTDGCVEALVRVDPGCK